MKKKLLKAFMIIILIIGIFITGIWILLAQPTFQRNALSMITVDIQRLEGHVSTLCETFYPRNFNHIENLNKTAQYIKTHLEQAGAHVGFQEFDVSGRSYKNVTGVFGKGKGNKVIIGAHYDTFGDTPGADDNASGIAGLLELAILFGRNTLDREVELVAYTLEEPPFFGTEQMGSSVHACQLLENNEEIAGVIVLEMIGCFSDTWGSQGHPMLLLKLIYPMRANFIGVVGRLDQRAFTKKVKVGMKGATDLPVYSINAPVIVPGIDLSDHRNYWPVGINAVMITDTSFYRNRDYHGLGDTVDQLDFHRMAKVIISVFEAVNSI